MVKVEMELAAKKAATKRVADQAKRRERAERDARIAARSRAKTLARK